MIFKCRAANYQTSPKVIDRLITRRKKFFYLNFYTFVIFTFSVLILSYYFLLFVYYNICFVLLKK